MTVTFAVVSLEGLMNDLEFGAFSGPAELASLAIFLRELEVERVTLRKKLQLLEWSLTRKIELFVSWWMAGSK